MTFSVIVPLYNGERFLSATLDAILGQSLPAADIIVIDDGSTDGGPAIARGYGDRITLLSLDGNSGVQAARNAGIGVASGEWIAFCDQDDLWDACYLARAERLRRSVPELDFLFANFRMVRDGIPDQHTKFDQAPPGWWQAAKRREQHEGWTFEGPIAGQTFLWQPIFPSAMLVTRKLIETVGGFDVAMRGLRPEDWEFTLRCLYRAKVGALPDPLVTIRRHETNFSRDVVMISADEVMALQFVKRTHAEAAPFHAIIDREISTRRVEAVEGAFAQRNHALARRLLADVAPADRSARLRLKALCLALPDALGLKLNWLLQRLSEMRQ